MPVVGFQQTLRLVSMFSVQVLASSNRRPRNVWVMFRVVEAMEYTAPPERNARSTGQSSWACGGTMAEPLYLFKRRRVSVERADNQAGQSSWAGGLT